MERHERNSASYRSRALDRRNPLNWLIFGGVLLIASIAVGTAITVLSFRERALKTASASWKTLFCSLPVISIENSMTSKPFKGTSSAE